MKQLKFSSDKLIACFNKFIELVDGIENEHNRNAAKTLMENLGERFFEAPASGRLEYHNCMPGGLVEHSLRVYTLFSKLAAEFGEDYSEDDIRIAALFHDFGKVGTDDEPYFVPKNSQWHQEKMGMYYEHNPRLRFMPHAQRSLQTLMSYDFDINNDVYTGILIHDGQYVAENAPYAMKEGRFALLLSMADRLACEIEKDKWLAIQ